MYNATSIINENDSPTNLKTTKFIEILPILIPLIPELFKVIIGVKYYKAICNILTENTYKSEIIPTLTIRQALAILPHTKLSQNIPTNHEALITIVSSVKISTTFLNRGTYRAIRFCPISLTNIAFNAPLLLNINDQQNINDNKYSSDKPKTNNAISVQEILKEKTSALTLKLKNELKFIAKTSSITTVNFHFFRALEGKERLTTKHSFSEELKAVIICALIFKFINDNIDLITAIIVNLNKPKSEISTNPVNVTRLNSKNNAKNK